MRFAGIDIGAERHMVAVLDEQGEVLCRSTPFGEDATGYARLHEVTHAHDVKSGGTRSSARDDNRDVQLLISEYVSTQDQVGTKHRN